MATPSLPVWCTGEDVQNLPAPFGNADLCGNAAESHAYYSCLVDKLGNTPIRSELQQLIDQLLTCQPDGCAETLKNIDAAFVGMKDELGKYVKTYTACLVNKDNLESQINKLISEANRSTTVVVESQTFEQKYPHIVLPDDAVNLANTLPASDKTLEQIARLYAKYIAATAGSTVNIDAMDMKELNSTYASWGDNINPILDTINFRYDKRAGSTSRQFVQTVKTQSVYEQVADMIDYTNPEFETHAAVVYAVHMFDAEFFVKKLAYDIRRNDMEFSSTAKLFRRIQTLRDVDAGIRTDLARLAFCAHTKPGDSDWFNTCPVELRPPSFEQFSMCLWSHGSSKMSQRVLLSDSDRNAAVQLMKGAQKAAERPAAAYISRLLSKFITKDKISSAAGALAGSLSMPEWNPQIPSGLIGPPSSTAVVVSMQQGPVSEWVKQLTLRGLNSNWMETQLKKIPKNWLMAMDGFLNGVPLFYDYQQCPSDKPSASLLELTQELMQKKIRVVGSGKVKMWKFRDAEPEDTQEFEEGDEWALLTKLYGICPAVLFNFTVFNKEP